MGIISGLAVYFIVWWLVLFTVLPWRAEPETSPEQGHAHSAPADPRLRLKFLITTAIAAIIWLVIYGLIQVEIVDFRAAADQMIKEDLS